VNWFFNDLVKSAPKFVQEEAHEKLFPNFDDEIFDLHGEYRIAKVLQILGDMEEEGWARNREAQRLADFGR